MKAAGIAKEQKAWTSTRKQGLYRHRNGNYYARFKKNGKQFWKSLDTSHFSVAEARIDDLKKEQRKIRKTEHAASSAKMTFGDAAALKMAQVNKSVTVKSRTKKYWAETIKSLEDTWPELFRTEVRRVTPSDCKTWAASYARTMSATRYNGAVTTLRHVFDLAIENGVIYTNPAAEIERRSVKAKQLELPTRAKFAEFVETIRTAGARQSKDCADLTQGIAFTGCRIGETWEIEWRDLDFTHDEIVVRGDPVEATKNSEIRRVPMIPQARELFERMRSERTDKSPAAKVFGVRDCEKSMTNAAKKVGIARITHHDLRHFFATICIESGVDIPTVSRWLGHKDGGALAMRTYGHLRREHSAAQAQKVSFAATQ